MSFKDIFKKSFIEGYASSDITLRTVGIALLIASVLAMYIFIIYRVMTRKTFYSKSFNISGVTVITTALILTMQSSVVLSLGMVGALSIVRFRTAIKNPIDLMFLFWSISVGIICGAGLAQVAVVLSAILTLGILVLSHIPVAKAPMLLVVNTSNLNSEKAVIAEVEQFDKHFHVKSRNMTVSSLDLVVELRTARGSDLVSRVMQLDGVTSVSLLSHDGDATF